MSEVEVLFSWCASALGPFELVADHSRAHPDSRTASWRLRTSAGDCYLKGHRQKGAWESEVYAYEQWAPAFAGFAPRLLAVREEEPWALVVSRLPGRIMTEFSLAPEREQAVWQSAGRALALFHDQAVGEWFGPCRRDGSPAGDPVHDAGEYISREFDRWLARGTRSGCLSADELVVVDAARSLIPAFAGERPLPCHRDYCPDNWLVTDDGAWAGVIDFEFAAWDVRVADFTRTPQWESLERPDLLEAFSRGYGRPFSPQEEQQRLVAHVQYALGAIVWGVENDYHGFAAEGRQALRHLARLL